MASSSTSTIFFDIDGAYVPTGARPRTAAGDRVVLSDIMATVLLTNSLEPDFPDRERIEAAVRTAFEAFEGGPWNVKLAQSSRPGRVSIDLVLPHSVSGTSVVTNASVDTIAKRVRVMLDPPCA